MKTREDVWEAFADQFLDTETRTWIPRAALTALDAGFTRAEAYDAWRFEVTPAVWPNLYDVAGEWAMWDRDWLVARIARKRRRPSRVNDLWYGAIIGGTHEKWVAIDACMEALSRSASREELAAQLEWHAERLFDFCVHHQPPKSTMDLSCVYETVFLPIFQPLLAS